MDFYKKSHDARQNTPLQQQKQNKDFGGQFNIPKNYIQATSDLEETIDKNQNRQNLQSEYLYGRGEETKVASIKTNQGNYNLNIWQQDELNTRDQQQFYTKQWQAGGGIQSSSKQAEQSNNILSSYQALQRQSQIPSFQNDERNHFKPNFEGLPQTLQSPQMLNIQRPVQTGYITSDQEEYDKYGAAQHSSKSQQNMLKNMDTIKFPGQNQSNVNKFKINSNQQNDKNLAKNQQSSITTQRSVTPRGQNFYQTQQFGPITSRNDQMRSSLENRSQVSLGGDSIKQANERQRQIVRQIEGRDKIIKALKLNKDIKQAIRQKIRSNTFKAITMIIRALRKFQTFKKAQLLRRQGIFDATIYLETHKNEKLNANTKVECFGEFSRNKKWQVRVPCVYQESTQCFKCNIQIKVGDHFKFVIENGQRYMVSNRYQIETDLSGNSNNVFQTKQIRWNNNERKKKKSYGSEHNYNIQAFKKNSWAQKSEYLVTQQKKQNNNDNMTLIHKQNNFTMNVGNDIFDFQKAQQIEYYNIDMQKIKGEYTQEDSKLSKTNMTNIQNDQIHQHIYNYASRNMNERLDSNSTSNKSITPSSLNINQLNQQQQQKVGTFWEPNIEQVKYNRDFKELFEEFLGGDLSTQAYSHKTIQSGLHVFQYNEEEEYVENLNISGIFPNMTEKALKCKQKAKSNQNLDAVIQLIPSNYISDCSVEKEIEIIKNYPNIFDLTIQDQEGKKVSLNYKDLSMEQMHKRYTSPKKIVINKKPIVVLKHQQPIVNQKNVKSQQASPIRSAARAVSKNSGNTSEIIQKTQQNPIKVHENNLKIFVIKEDSQKKNTKKNTSPKSDGEGPLMLQNQKSRYVGEISLPIPQIDESEETQIKIIKSQLQSNSTQSLKQQKIEETISQQKSQEQTASKESLKVVKESQKSPREYKKSPEESKTSTIELKKSQQNQIENLEKSLKESGNSIVPIAEVILNVQESEEAISNTVIDEQSQNQNPDKIQHSIMNQEQQILKAQIISKNNEIEITMNLQVEQEFQANILQEQKVSCPEDQDQIKTSEPEITISPNIYIESIEQKIAVIKQESDEPCPFIIKVDENDIQESEAAVLEDQNIVKRTSVPDTQNLSEISFFYENDEEEDSKDSEGEDEDEKADFILIQGAHCQGKAPHQCEDAYFVSDRAFGVSDGVSGWNDYGFSSDQFSLQLMSFSKQILEKCLRNGLKSKNSRLSQKKSSSKNSRMRKNQSFLSMDNLDIQEQSEEDEDTNSKDDQGHLSLNSSRSSQSDTAEDVGSQGNQIDRNVLKKSLNKLGHKTERHDKELSPLRKSDNLDAHSQSNVSQNIHISAQLEREISRKMNQVKINQDYINNWTWDLRKSINQDAFQKGTAQNGDEVTFKNTPSKEMKINSQMYNTVLFPTYILQKAFLKVNAVGSATALIAILNKDELSIANVGDSGFLVIRFKNGEPYCPHKSKEQQHAFNIPFQLSQLPTQADLEILRKQGKLSEMAKLKNVLKKKNNVCQDSPESADDYTVELRDGDIVVTATDGVFDNLFQHEILTIVGDYRKEQGSKLTKDSQAQELAQILVNASIDKFKNPKGKKTPYQRKYKKTYNATWEGGKEDDITVLVSIARKVRVIKPQLQNDEQNDNNQGKIFTEQDLKDIIDI